MILRTDLRDLYYDFLKEGTFDILHFVTSLLHGFIHASFVTNIYQFSFEINTTATIFLVALNFSDTMFVNADDLSFHFLINHNLLRKSFY